MSDIVFVDPNNPSAAMAALCAQQQAHMERMELAILNVLVDMGGRLDAIEARLAVVTIQQEELIDAEEETQEEIEEESDETQEEIEEIDAGEGDEETHEEVDERREDNDNDRHFARR